MNSTANDKDTAKWLIAFVLFVLVLVAGVAFFKGTGASAAPITTDLRNTLYLDGDTIKTSPADAVILQIKNLLFSSGASSTIQGTVTDNATWTSTGTHAIGSSGTAVAQEIYTTCTGIAYAELAATSSLHLSCPVTGLTTAYDFVHAQLASSTGAGMSGNISIVAAGASTTAGYADITVMNMTGAATSSYPLATTSIQVHAVQY